MSTKRDLPPSSLDDLAAHAFDAPLAEARELTGGTFNTVYLLETQDGTRAVLKVAPPPEVALMTYEQGILATEVRCLQAFTTQTRVPVPQVLAADPSGALLPGMQGRRWLLTSFLPGQPLDRAELSEAERSTVRYQLGSMVAQLHGATHDGPFGYPASPTLQAFTWRAALMLAVEAVLTDAETWGTRLPLLAEQIRTVLDSDVLDGVASPVLTHFDLWDGNVLVERGRITGLVDHERALWADPAADFVSLSLFGDITTDAEFLAGYAAADGPVVIDEAMRCRQRVYRAYLALVMLVEAGPRGHSGPEAEAWQERVRTWLVSELGAVAQGRAVRSARS